MKPFCRIGELATMLTEKPHTVRFWEQEFGIKPERSSKGHRVYSRAQVVKLMAVRSLLREMGFTIAGARARLAEAEAKSA